MWYSVGMKLVTAAALVSLTACAGAVVKPDAFKSRLEVEVRESFSRWQAACGLRVFERVPSLVVLDADLGAILGAEGVGQGLAPDGVPWIVINREADWREYDLGTVVDHEVGHVLGLKHTDQKTGRPLMRPKRTFNEIVRPAPADCPR